MKRKGICSKIVYSSVLILLCLLILLSFSVEAGAIDRTNATKPLISFLYKEPVRIHSASIFMNKTNLSFQVAYTPNARNDTWTFQPVKHLSNGNYSLNVRASDLVNNYRITNYSFEVLAPFMKIWTVVPPLGASRTNPFRLVIATEKPAVKCKYSLDQPFDFANLYFSFTPSIGNTQHSIENFYICDTGTTCPLLHHDSRTMHVKCNETETGRIHSAALMLTYDTDAPGIKYRIDPASRIVQEPSPPYKFAKVYIETNDLTICRIRDTSPNGQTIYSQGYNESIRDPFRVNHEMVLNYSTLAPDATQIFHYQMICRNLVNLSSMENFEITVRPSTDFDITMLSPGRYTNQLSFNFTIATSVSTNCRFKDEKSSEFTQFSGSNTISKWHSKYLQNIGNGSHTFTVFCSSTAASKTQEFSVLVDTVNPGATTVETDNITCSLNRMHFTLEAEDRGGSNIKGYNYTITDSAGELLENKFTSKSSVNVQGLDLDENMTYTVDAFAVDSAGNEGASGTADIMATKQTYIPCDLNKPTGRLAVNHTQFGVRIKVLCSDLESGCADVFDFCYSTNLSGRLSCDYTQKSYLQLPILISGFDKVMVFYKVYDLNRNEFNASQLIESNASADHCMNTIFDSATESDTDCGIECDLCEDNRTCTKDSDCLSNYCPEGVCEAVSCLDGKKNGGETDIDCGGSCEPCGLGQNCTINLDCASTFCHAYACTEPLCNDTIKNGNETDVDCGGSCDSCALGKKCIASTDCETGLCQQGKCTDTGYDDDDDDDTPDEEEKSSLGLILLILGLVMLFGGAGYIYYTKQKSPAGSRAGYDSSLSGAPGGTGGDSLGGGRSAQKPAGVRSAVAERIAKQRLLKRQKYRSQLLSTFGIGESRRQQQKKPLLKPVDRPGSEEEDHPEEESEDYVELSAVRPGRKSGDKEKAEKDDDVFAKISDLAKQPDRKGKKNDSKNDSKGDDADKKGASQKSAGKKGSKNPDDGPESKSGNETGALPGNQDGAFDRLNALAEQGLTKEELAEKISSSSGVKGEKVADILKQKSKAEIQKGLSDIFSKADDKKKASANISLFKILFGKGHLSKENISDILFEYQDREFITKSEVSDIMKSLEMI